MGIIATLMGAGAGGGSTQAGGGSFTDPSSIGGSSVGAQTLALIQGGMLLPANVIKGYQGISQNRAQRGLTRAQRRLAEAQAAMLKAQRKGIKRSQNVFSGALGSSFDGNPFYSGSGSKMFAKQNK